MPINVTIWNEFLEEKEEGIIKETYPNGIHKAVGEALSVNKELNIRYATLEDPECGLTDEVIDNTDVLLWWGHCAHDQVPDEIAEKVQNAVLKGMGFIPLHSAHMCKPFIRLMGTSCCLKWCEGDRERVWNVMPSHPIAQGIPDYFELPDEEMYGEFFDIPTPDDIIFIGWFAGGEAFRSGCTFTRGYGKIFYFQPGHEEYPIYKNEYVKRILNNAVNWAAPITRLKEFDCPYYPSLEKK